MSKQYTPPADLLLKQYIRLAQSLTDKAVPQVLQLECSRALSEIQLNHLHDSRASASMSANMLYIDRLR